MQPGDVVVHHGEIIHRADPNRSATRQRRAFAMNFEGVSCRVDEEAKQRQAEAAKKQHREMGLDTDSYF
jgi:phytanoyl-CoA hydroxylase